MNNGLLRTLNGQTIELLHRISAGGEGTIWQTNIPQLVAKIYHSPTDQLQEKIEMMIQNPPLDPMDLPDHISIAWPSQELYDDKSHFEGFLMPRISGSLTLNHIYNPKLRKKFAPGFNWFYLHTTALNIASIMQSLHQRGYVVGDIKTDNFLVTEQAMVSSIDTDSFQIKVGSKVFPSPTGSEGFTPPELIGQDFHEVYRTDIHDRFGLAVLIHLLLTGYHPFSGEWVDPDAPESSWGRDAIIQQGIWPYDGKHRIKPSPYAIPYDVFIPEIKKAFLQTFNDGHQQPDQRLSAKDWQDLLQYALRQLTVCDKNPNHYHDQRQGCYWCDRAVETGLEIFPSLSVGEKEYILQHFIRALQSKDIKAISNLWQHHTFLHQDQRLKMHHPFIHRACDYMVALHQFMELCEGDTHTDQILEWWAQDERLSFFPPDPTIEIRGQSLSTFLQVLQEKHKSLQDLKAAIGAADALVTVDEDHEKSIVHQLHRTPWSEDVRLREPALFERATLAEKRISTLQKFRHYFLQKNEAAVADLASTHEKYLKDFTLTVAQGNFLTTSQFLSTLYNEIVFLLVQGPSQDVRVITLWEENPLIATSSFAQKYHSFQGENITIEESIKRARRRVYLQSHLKSLLQQTDYITISNLWDQAADYEKSVFDPYQDTIQQGKHKKTIWTHLRRAALEHELKHHILDWDEVNFYPLAKTEKLQAVLQDAFVHAYDPVTFPENFKPFLAHHRDFKEIQWPWPQAKWPVPLCLWAIRSDRFPDSPHDVDQSFQSGWVWNHTQNPRGTTFVPFQGERAIAAIWPAHFVCQKPVMLGAPLKIETLSPVKVPYTYSFKKSFLKKEEGTLILRFYGTGPVEMPPLSLYGSNQFPPVHSDPKKIRLGSLQPFKILGKVSGKKYTEIKIKMTKPSQMIEGQPFFIRVYPPVDYQGKMLQLIPPLDVTTDVKK